MRTEFIDVSDTRKSLVVEIPSSVVDAEIDRITRDYSRAARIPGFRPGKVPPRLVRQRFREQILHDVAHGLIPKAVDSALRERGLEPVDTPDIRDVFVQEGQPLKFVASFETVPPIDPGDLTTIVLRRKRPAIEAGAVDRAIDQLRERAARFDPVEGRGVEPGDTVLVDLDRRVLDQGGAGPGASETHESVSVDIGSPANPPGFDDELLGLDAGSTKTFTLAYPPDYSIAALAGARVEYTVRIKSVRRKVVPELDDEFAKDVGAFDSLAELRTHAETTLRQEAAAASERQLRAELLQELARRVSADVPAALTDREIDRRVEEFVHRLLEQQVDPMRTNIDWEEFRERQRGPAADAVRAALVLDEVARREGLAATEPEVDREVALFAERSGRTPAAVRAGLEKEGGLGRLRAGLRREKAIDWLLGRVRIFDE